MKYLILGLFSLALLGFVCAKNASATIEMPYNNTSNATWPYNYSTTSNNNNINGNNNNINGNNINGNNINGNNGNNISGNNINGNNINGNNISGNNNNNITGTNPISMMPSTTRPMSITVPGGKTIMNRQNHIFISVRLLFGSFLLHFLWQ